MIADGSSDAFYSKFRKQQRSKSELNLLDERKKIAVNPRIFDENSKKCHRNFCPKFITKLPEHVQQYSNVAAIIERSSKSKFALHTKLNKYASDSNCSLIVNLPNQVGRKPCYYFKPEPSLNEKMGDRGKKKMVVANGEPQATPRNKCVCCKRRNCQMWSDGDYSDSTTSADETADVYRSLLGPTPDETILAGLQTVIDMCGMLETPRNKDMCENSISSDDRSTNYQSDSKSYPLYYCVNKIDADKKDGSNQTNGSREKRLFTEHEMEHHNISPPEPPTPNEDDYESNTPERIISKTSVNSMKQAPIENFKRLSGDTKYLEDELSKSKTTVTSASRKDDMFSKGSNKSLNKAQSRQYSPRNSGEQTRGSQRISNASRKDDSLCKSVSQYTAGEESYRESSKKSLNKPESKTYSETSREPLQNSQRISDAKGRNSIGEEQRRESVKSKQVTSDAKGNRVMACAHPACKEYEENYNEMNKGNQQSKPFSDTNRRGSVQCHKLLDKDRYNDGVICKNPSCHAHQETPRKTSKTAGKPYDKILIKQQEKEEEGIYKDPSKKTLEQIPEQEKGVSKRFMLSNTKSSTKSSHTSEYGTNRESAQRLSTESGKSKSSNADYTQSSNSSFEPNRPVQKEKKSHVKLVVCPEDVTVSKEMEGIPILMDCDKKKKKKHRLTEKNDSISKNNSEQQNVDTQTSKNSLKCLKCKEGQDNLDGQTQTSAISNIQNDVGCESKGSEYGKLDCQMQTSAISNIQIDVGCGSKGTIHTGKVSEYGKLDGHVQTSAINNNQNDVGFGSKGTLESGRISEQDNRHSKNDIACGSKGTIQTGKGSEYGKLDGQMQTSAISNIRNDMECGSKGAIQTGKVSEHGNLDSQMQTSPITTVPQNRDEENRRSIESQTTESVLSNIIYTVADKSSRISHLNDSRQMDKMDTISETDNEFDSSRRGTSSERISNAKYTESLTSSSTLYKCYCDSKDTTVTKEDLDITTEDMGCNSVIVDSTNTKDTKDFMVFSALTCQCNPAKLEQQRIRYAYTKITEFEEYTTYEILKIPLPKPKVPSPTPDGVFVVKRKS